MATFPPKKPSKAFKVKRPSNFKTADIEPEPKELVSGSFEDEEFRKLNYNPRRPREKEIPKMRECLRCCKSFLSEHRFNRMCHHCKGVDTMHVRFLKEDTP